MAEFRILVGLVNYLKKKNIHYILCGGSLLGAVRHNGFIPWDDDIDILVPRDDYEELKRLYRSDDNELGDICLKLPGDKDSPHPFIKAIDKSFIVYDEKRGEEFRANLWVDVFPMDHFPDNTILHWLYLKCVLSLVRVLSANTITKEYLISRGYYREPVKFLKLIISKVLYKMLGGSSEITKLIDRMAFIMDAKCKQSNHVGDGVWPSGMNDYFPLSTVEPVIKHKFEDGEFYIPKNYDEYLSIFYGDDYMTIPPENKRIDHHITVYRVG